MQGLPGKLVILMVKREFRLGEDDIGRIAGQLGGPLRQRLCLGDLAQGQTGAALVGQHDPCSSLSEPLDREPDDLVVLVLQKQRLGQRRAGPLVIDAQPRGGADLLLARGAVADGGQDLCRMPAHKVALWRLGGRGPVIHGSRAWIACADREFRLRE